jgi:hypothetical protein
VSVNPYNVNASLVATFVEALNRKDPDDLLTVVADDVELHTRSGVLRGRRQVTQWLGSASEMVERLALSALLVGEDRVIGFGATVGGPGPDARIEVERVAVWQIRDGVISSWRPAASAQDAFAAAGYGSTRWVPYHG